MNKEQARNLLMDYMYGELENDQLRALEKYLQTDEELRQEFEELSETRSLLQHLPVQSPDEQLVMMAPEEQESKKEAVGSNWWNTLKTALIPQQGFTRVAFGVATFLFLFVLTGALTDMNMSINDNGFSLTFGEQPTVQTGYTAEQVELIVSQVQQDNAAIINEYIEEAQAQQQLQFEQTLSTFADYFNDQRESDWELFNYGLTSLEETTYNRFQQTDQVLGEIIETVSTN